MSDKWISLQQRIRAILEATAGGLRMNMLEEEYYDCCLVELPLSEFGLSNVAELVAAMPETVKVVKDKNGGPSKLHAIPITQTSHVVMAVNDSVKSGLTKENTRFGRKIPGMRNSDEVQLTYDSGPIDLNNTVCKPKEVIFIPSGKSKQPYDAKATARINEGASTSRSNGYRSNAKAKPKPKHPSHIPNSESNHLDVIEGPEFSKECLERMPPKLRARFERKTDTVMRDIWNRVYTILHTYASGTDWILCECMSSLYNMHFSRGKGINLGEHTMLENEFGCKNIRMFCVALQEWIDHWWDPLGQMRIRLRERPRNKGKMVTASMSVGKKPDKHWLAKQKYAIHKRDAAEDDSDDDMEEMIDGIRLAPARHDAVIGEQLRKTIYYIILRHFPHEGCTLCQIINALQLIKAGCSIERRMLQCINPEMTDVLHIESKSPHHDVVHVRLDIKVKIPKRLLIMADLRQQYVLEQARLRGEDVDKPIVEKPKKMKSNQKRVHFQGDPPVVGAPFGNGFENETQQPEEMFPAPEHGILTNGVTHEDNSLDLELELADIEAELEVQFDPADMGRLSPELNDAWESIGFDQKPHMNGICVAAQVDVFEPTPLVVMMSLLEQVGSSGVRISVMKECVKMALDHYGMWRECDPSELDVASLSECPDLVQSTYSQPGKRDLWIRSVDYDSETWSPFVSLDDSADYNKDLQNSRQQCTEWLKTHFNSVGFTAKNDNPAQSVSRLSEQQPSDLDLSDEILLVESNREIQLLMDLVFHYSTKLTQGVKLSDLPMLYELRYSEAYPCNSVLFGPDNMEILLEEIRGRDEVFTLDKCGDTDWRVRYTEGL